MNRRHPSLSRLARVGLVAAAALALSGCDQQQLRDLEDVPQREPDRAELYTNVDEYPNIVRICIDGVAFATTTREYQPVMRVPEWDTTFCGGDAQ